MWFYTVNTSLSHLSPVSVIIFHLLILFLLVLQNNLASILCISLPIMHEKLTAVLRAMPNMSSMIKANLHGRLDSLAAREMSFLEPPFCYDAPIKAIFEHSH